jgi:hypothetical protein
MEAEGLQRRVDSIRRCDGDVHDLESSLETVVLELYALDPDYWGWAHGAGG